jgi:RND family efflux transporter MFP subunit
MRHLKNLLACAAFVAALAGAAPAQNAPKEFDGTILPVRESNVNARVVTTVAEIRVTEGQEVAEGQVLARLDDAVPRLESSAADINAVNTAPYESTVKNLEQARRDLERVQKSDLSASKADIEKAQLTLDQCEIAVRSRANELAQARALAALKRAQAEEYYVRAPFKGSVAAKSIEVGESTYPQDRRLFQIIDISKVYVEVPVPLKSFMKLKVGHAATVDAACCPGKAFQGKVSFLAPAAEAGGGYFRVKVLVDNPGESLRPGTTAKVSFAGVLDEAKAPVGEERSAK